MADFLKRKQEEEGIENLLDIEDNRRVQEEIDSIAENERKEVICSNRINLLQPL